MLGRNDHRIDPFWLAVHVFDTHLALAIGPEVRNLTRAPRFAELAYELVREHDWQRHELGSFVAGIAEHEALISGTARIDAHRDIGRLRLNHVDYGASLAIESE